MISSEFLADLPSIILIRSSSNFVIKLKSMELFINFSI